MSRAKMPNERIERPLLTTLTSSPAPRADSTISLTQSESVFKSHRRMALSFLHMFLECFFEVIRFDFNKETKTPNKEYMVRNYSTYKMYDGRFMISFKKEVMLKDGINYIPSMIIGLRKILE